MIIENKANKFAGIGGLVGASIAAVVAFSRYDFAITDQLERGVGFIVAGLIVGALLGYIVGKFTS